MNFFLIYIYLYVKIMLGDSSYEHNKKYNRYVKFIKYG